VTSVANYATPGGDPSLYPDEPNEYAVVVMDELKPPDSDDFLTVLSEFEDDDFELPTEKNMYTYLIHTADGETVTRGEWESDEDNE
jgi:hypothetical protein